MKNLVNLRKSLSLNQRDMALKLNMAKATYAHYESGRSEPSIETLIKLADFFNCSTDYLIGHKITTSEIKQNLINSILSLDDDLCSLAEAYIEGLKTTQKQRDMVRSRVSQQNNNIEEDID